MSLGPFILVVEDDEQIRDTMVEMLTDEGYPAKSAANGQLALDFLNESSSLPSLILLDMMMPVMDGRDFRREQAKQARLAEIPTVLVSADSHLAEKAESLGIDRYIKKPLDLLQLFELAEKFLGRRSG